MTEREKLMELLCKAPLGNYPLGEQFSNGTVEKIADFLLENGVIPLPAKVGDMVYSVWCDDDGKFQIDENEILDVSARKVWIEGGGFEWDSIGVTDFLTREEAKKALAERSG